MASAESTATTLAVLATCTALASQLEQRTHVGKNVSAPVLTMAAASAAASARLLPRAEAALTFTWDALLPLAVALSLLTIDVLELQPLRDGLVAFALAAVATLVGTVVACALVGSALGEHGHHLAACLCASYIGGSVNFAAVAATLSFGVSASGRSLLFAAMAVDNIAMALFLAVLLHLARTPTSILDGGGTDDRVLSSSDAPVTVASLASALASALCCTALSQAIATRLGAPSWKLAILAVLAPALSSLLARIPRAPPPSQLLAGAEQMAGALLLLFFAALGASADITSASSLGAPAFLFIAIQLGVHIAVLLILGKAARMPRRLLLLASNAAVGGPATAAAMATALGWRSLVRPAILLGCFGYAIGTPIGVLVGNTLQQW